MTTIPIHEIEVTIISENTRLQGEIEFSESTRVHGTVQGKIFAPAGSKLVLSESSVIEGNVTGDDIAVSGYVKGDIMAAKRVLITSSGRVLGNIRSKSIAVEFGGIFEGSCTMEDIKLPEIKNRTNDSALST